MLFSSLRVINKQTVLLRINLLPRFIKKILCALNKMEEVQPDFVYKINIKKYCCNLQLIIELINLFRVIIMIVIKYELQSRNFTQNHNRKPPRSFNKSRYFDMMSERRDMTMYEEL